MNQVRHYKKLPVKKSESREKVMQAIVVFSQENGYSPTVRELSQMTGLASTSSVHAHLKTLAREGRITFEPTKPRTIAVCDRQD